MALEHLSQAPQFLGPFPNQIPYLSSFFFSLFPLVSFGLEKLSWVIVYSVKIEMIVTLTHLQ